MMRTAARRALVAMVAMAVPHALLAHPIHTTYAEVTVTGGQATVTVRAFADDFAAAVARFNRRAVPADSAAPAADVASYLGAMLQVRDAEGRAVALQPCGVRRAGVLTYVCVRVPVRAGLRVTNRILTELHADQVNIMQQRGGRTLLFTASAAAQPFVQ